MACEVVSMNSFRKAVLTGKGLKGDPVVQQKSKRGAAEDDLSSVEVSAKKSALAIIARSIATGWNRKP